MKTKVPEYILSLEHITIDDGERELCIYIDVMVADHRVDRALRKGSGAALIQGIREFARKSQRKCLFIDGWSGNSRKLIGFVSPKLSLLYVWISQGLINHHARYYDQQGFQVINDFSLPRKDKNPWVGTLMRMDVE